MKRNQGNKIKPAKKPARVGAPAARVLSLPVVGIGASAGGLEAIKDFLSNVPSDSGAAFIVVQHLEPNRKSLLAGLLAKDSALPVEEAVDGLKIRPNRLYVIPPHADVSFLRGSIHLSEPSVDAGMHLPIDFFFNSLAQEFKDKACAVVLSGMGADGVSGLRAIRENGGVSFIQTPSTAIYSSMPRSAIDSGLADVVAPAEDLPKRILSHLSRMASGLMAEAPLDETSRGALDKIMIQLRAATGHDFSLYKTNTIFRRIERRMSIHQISKLADYARFLKDEPQEVDLLFRELLIGVTSFFRDPQCWEELRREVLPGLLGQYSKGGLVRAWVAGCSTGEDAYSLAMLFREAADEMSQSAKLSFQIFATDIDNDAIEKARRGVFPASAAADISPARLNKFFVEDAGGYRARKEVREMITFARQDLILDPPFTKLDLVICRNLLIYFTSELQRKIFPLFHYTLKPHGVLFLGSAETVGSASDLFSLLPGKAKIYRRVDLGPRRAPMDFPMGISQAGKDLSPIMMSAIPAAAQNIEAQTDLLLLERHAPAAVLTNEKGDIIYIRGRTGKYLEPAAGKANLNIFAMARDGLRYDLRQGFARAQKSGKIVNIKNIKVGSNGGSVLVNAQIQPLSAPQLMKGKVMFVFSDAVPVKVKELKAKSGRKRLSESRMIQIERDLEEARSELHAAREDMQHSQEEYRSVNEELQSTNEELQSANEELTTSKEEIQSMNEELQTVNQELQRKIDELSGTNNDMKNLLNSTNIATLFLDEGLCVRRFTTQASQIIKLIPSDVGRPMTDISSSLVYPDLADDAHSVLRDLIPIEKVVPTISDSWYSVRIMPYRTQENKIDGVVLTFTDVSQAKHLEAELTHGYERITSILDAVDEPYIFLDPHLSLVGLNRAAEMLFGQTRAALLGRNMFDLLPMDQGAFFSWKCVDSLKLKEESVFSMKIGVLRAAVDYEVRLVPNSAGIAVLLKKNIKQAKADGDGAAKSNAK